MIKEDKKEPDDKEPEEPVNYWKKLGLSLVPINLEEWPDMPGYKRAFEVFKVSVHRHPLQKHGVYLTVQNT